MDFQPNKQKGYTSDEVADIASRVASVVAIFYNMENVERGFRNNYPKMEFALDAIEILERYREVPEDIRDRLNEFNFDCLYVGQLEDLTNKWLERPNIRELPG